MRLKLIAKATLVPKPGATIRLLFFLAVAVLLPFGPIPAQADDLACGASTDMERQDNLKLVSTFESISVYWRPFSQMRSAVAYARFKKADTSAQYRRSLDFIYAVEEEEYRGSLVQLDAGTTYDIELVLNDQVQRTISAVTWCEEFPIARVVQIGQTEAQTNPIRIKDVHGTADGYVLYAPVSNANTELDGTNVNQNIIIENSTFVIVRGFHLQNAKENAILIRGAKKTHDIVIEQNTVENWGDVNSDNGFGNASPAIKTANGDGKNYRRLIVQRNIIRNPRGGANSWAEYRDDVKGCTQSNCHPRGPSGLYLNQTAGNHVIRYNDIYSTNGHYFMDGIGGAKNFTLLGFPHRDSDIYGNFIQNVWDDAIESEGANMNVRIWANYIDQTYVALAISPVSKGPVYLFRNVVHRTQRTKRDSLSSGVFVKAQTRREIGAGAIFFFHNTAFRSQPAQGVRLGVSGSGGPLINFFSRNNIVDATSRAFVGKGQKELEDSSFDFDLFLGNVTDKTNQETNGIEGSPIYRSSCPLDSSALTEGSPGIDQGMEIPNFNDNHIDGPDMGAQENGRPRLEFGRHAYTAEGPVHSCS